MIRTDFGGPVEDFALEIGSVSGIRGFRVTRNGSLTGITHPAYYGPGVNVAKCHICRTKQIDGCTCGYYAYFSADRARLSFMNYGDVGAVVRGYGRTVVGTRGFRASKSDLVALFPLEDLPQGPPKRSWFSKFYPSYSTMVKIGKSAELTVLPAFLGIMLILAAIVALPIALAYGNLAVAAISALLVAPGTPWMVGWMRRVEIGGNCDFRYIYPEAPAKLMRLVRGEPALNQKHPIFRAAAAYPNVPTYRSLAEALENHPVSSAEEFGPVPDADPDDAYDLTAQMLRLLKGGI